MKKMIILLNLMLIIFTGCTNIDKKEITVHFKKPDSWPCDVYVYYYKDENVSVGFWPGVIMNKDGNEWYSYTISENWYKESKVMFYGDDEHRNPQHMEPGFEIWKIGNGKDLWYLENQWYLKNPEE